eukprot:g22367.t1
MGRGSSASGTGAKSKTPRKPKVQRTPSASPEKAPTAKGKDSAKVIPAPATGKRTENSIKKTASEVDQVLSSLQRWSVPELTRLGEAVLQQLALRAQHGTERSEL